MNTTKRFRKILTAGTFAAYYIVWTLVRGMNIVYTPFGWEERIREGQLSAHLVRPIHPIHYDIGSFAGWKVVVIAMWLPIAAVLSLLFRPTLDPSMAQVATFAVAIWGAYLIRSLFLWVLGMICFWTTKVTAIFEAYFAAELLLSGRLLPVTLMPEWVQRVAAWLPFEVIGVAVGSRVVALVWRRAVRRYSAVSG